MTVSVGNDVLHVKGAHSFLLVASVRENFALCIETRCEEYIQGVHAGDLVVVSAPEAGPVEPALMLLELVRTYHLPLLVLPRDHPGSKRIPYVVSVGTGDPDQLFDRTGDASGAAPDLFIGRTRRHDAERERGRY